MASPVDQFKLKTLVPFEVGGVDLAYTTSSLWMTITVVAVTLFLTLSMRGGRLVPGRWQSLAEMSYEFIANMIRENVGHLIRASRDVFFVASQCCGDTYRTSKYFRT